MKNSSSNLDLSGDLSEKKLSSELIHKSEFLEHRLDSVRLPNGKDSKREYIIHTGGVVIVPFDGKNFILVRQFRYPVNSELLEFPAGRLDKLGESPEESAVRELSEETGYSASKIQKITYIYTAPGFCNEILHIFLAQELIAGEQHTEECEFVEIIHMSPSKLEELICTGKIQDSKTITAFYLAKKYLNI